MIYGIGSDIVQIPRIESLIEEFSDKFINKICHNSEAIKFNQIKLVDSNKAKNYLAKRFAAKEAFSKALGLGIRGKISFTNIEISNDNSGKPIIKLYGSTLDYVEKLFSNSNYNLHLSLSDDYPVAYAVVLIEII